MHDRQVQPERASFAHLASLCLTPSVLLLVGCGIRTCPETPVAAGGFESRRESSIGKETKPLAPPGNVPPAQPAYASIPADRRHQKECCQVEPPSGTTPKYARSVARYQLPDVTLTDSSGRKVALKDLLSHDGPVVVQLFFTSCSTICPVLSGSVQSAREQLGDAKGATRFLSITIDPQHDTPVKLADFAESFGADQTWLVLTGEPDAVRTVQVAFDAYQQNKMKHEPLTFIRPRPGAQWVRLNGLPSGKQLAAEIRRAVGLDMNER